MLEQQLIENCLREDLQPIEEAQAFRRLIDLNGWTGKQVAEALRVPPSKVSRTLALLKLPEEIQQQVTDGRISSRSAYELSKLDDDNTIGVLSRSAIGGRLTHAEAERAVRRCRGKRSSSVRGVRQKFALESGWKITVSSRRKGTYAEMELALEQVLEEVQHRMRNNSALM